MKQKPPFMNDSTGAHLDPSTAMNLNAMHANAMHAGLEQPGSLDNSGTGDFIDGSGSSPSYNRC